MIAMPKREGGNQVTNFITSALRSASLPPPMKVLSVVPVLSLCLLVALGEVRFVVMGFVTQSRIVGRRVSLGLVPVSQDIVTAPSLSSSSSPSQSPFVLTTSQVQRHISLKTEENTLSGSRLNSALLAFQSSDDDASAIRSKNMGTNKRNFFASLDNLETLNGATKERSELLAKMIEEKKVVAIGHHNKEDDVLSLSMVPTISYEKPGSTETFLASVAGAPVAEGTWKVVYAPHMTTAMDLFRGRFDVTYDLFPDSRIVSHAFYDFPVVLGMAGLAATMTFGTTRFGSGY